MIPNSVFDALLKSSLTLRQERVFQAVLRKTLGYNKSSDCIATSQLVEMTGIDDAHVRKALSILEDMGMLQRGKRTTQGTVITPILDVSAWKTERADSARIEARTGRLSPNRQADSAPHNRQLQNTEEIPNGILSSACAEDPVSRKPIRKDMPPVAEMLALYNSELGDRLPKAQLLNDSRKRALASRWSELLNSHAPDGSIRYADKESGLGWWAKLFRKVKLNPHWLGDNDRGWTANLDWILKPANFAKVLEYRTPKKDR